VKHRLALTAALGILALSAAPASARLLDHQVFRFDDTFTETVCGVDVTTHNVGHGNFTLRDQPGNALPLSQQSVNVTTTWTDESGDSISITTTGLSAKDVSITQSGDLFTFTYAYAGSPEVIRDGQGKVISKDVGHLVFADTWDFSDPENPVFVGSVTVQLAGPHPEADSNFELLCQIVNAYLD
jgi:hypothetical protein